MIFFVNYWIIITITSYIFSNVILMKMQRKRLKVKKIGAKLSSFVDSVMKKKVRFQRGIEFYNGRGIKILLQNL